MYHKIKDLFTTIKRDWEKKTQYQLKITSLIKGGRDFRQQWQLSATSKSRQTPC